MARVVSSLESRDEPDHMARVVMAAGIIAALYFGSEILIPVALAILLSFALAPVVKILQKLGLGRALPVLVAVLLAFLVTIGLAALMASQLRDLSADLPRYEATMVGKINTLKSLTNSAGIRKVEEAVSQFSKAVGRSAAPPESVAPTAGNHAAALEAGGERKSPVPVQVVSPPMGPLDAVMLVAAPLLHPLSIAFIVLIFVVFILLQREDLRNRAIRLFGANDLQRTTAAINDGGRRLSRYLLTQCAVNAGAGTVVGLGLWMIGVPSPILLGILFAAARFVPYIGPVMGSVLPVALATAVDPGWSMLLWTLALLAALELVIGQIVEPFVYGHNTGLSPIAIVLAATFWTVLWGPVGLFLSTPLTVCLVVLGRHVESLDFLDVLLGDRPPLSPAETFYQRMLADDPIEAAEQARRCLAEMTIAQYYDDVALPALLMAQDDAAQGRLDTDRQNRMKATVLEVADDLVQDAAEETPEDKRFSLFHFGKTDEKDKAASLDDLVPEQVPDALKVPRSVLCIGARTPLDDAAAVMLAQIFEAHGIGAVADGAARLSRTEIAALDLGGVSMIVLSSLEGSSPAFLRFILRRLRRLAPDIDIVVGAWWRRDGLRETDEEIDRAIRQAKVATFHDALRHIFARDEEASAPPVLSAAS